MNDSRKHIGPYVVDGEIGRGGMGVVYRATDKLSYFDNERESDVLTVCVPGLSFDHSEFDEMTIEEARRSLEQRSARHCRRSIRERLDYAFCPFYGLGFRGVLSDASR